MFGSEEGCGIAFPSCIPRNSASKEVLSNMAREQVLLNVYDMVRHSYFNSNCTIFSGQIPVSIFLRHRNAKTNGQ